MKSTVFIIALLIMVSLPSMVQACSCRKPDVSSALEDYNKADIVLRVKAIEFSKGWNASGPLVTFQILETYKTNQALGDTITAKNNPLTAACGNEINPDTEYVFGLWDLQKAGYEVKNAIGYRVMHSCAQQGVQHYIENYYTDTKDK